MDTTKEYINMCDCPEIQGMKKFLKENDVVYEEYDNRKDSKRKKWIFRPRQDQTQEMLGDMGKCYEIFYELVLFDQRNLGQEANSMEQLWLIVYMWEKHKKIWDGGKWVNEGVNLNKKPEGFQDGTALYWHRCKLCKNQFPGVIDDKDLICINCMEGLNKSDKKGEVRG